MIVTCDECKVTTTARMLKLDTVRKTSLCPTCFFRLNPPVLVIVKPWYTDNFIFPITGSIIYRPIDAFERCGFHLFNRKIFRSPKVSPRAEEVLTLFFRGKNVCNLLKEYYSNWHPMMLPCPVKVCI